MNCHNNEIKLFNVCVLCRPEIAGRCFLLFPNQDLQLALCAKCKMHRSNHLHQGAHCSIWQIGTKIGTKVGTVIKVPKNLSSVWDKAMYSPTKSYS